MIRSSQIDRLTAWGIIRNLNLNYNAPFLVEKLWEGASESFLDGNYLSTVILAGTCAEAAHKSGCRDKGMPTANVRWAKLIVDSVSNGTISSDIGCVLCRIKNVYRNKWVHLDLDEITRGIPIPPTAGSTTQTPQGITMESSSEEYKAIFANTQVEDQALDCLWLTAVSLDWFYGTMMLSLLKTNF